jgi:hypothetical protein
MLPEAFHHHGSMGMGLNNVHLGVVGPGFNPGCSNSDFLSKSSSIIFSSIQPKT